MIKKFVLAITMVFAFSFSMTSFAQDNSSDLSPYYQSALKEMTDSGLTVQEAQEIIKLDRISKEMEVNFQKVDLVEGKVKVINSENSKSKISKDDEAFLASYLGKHLKTKFKTREEKMKALTDEIKKNPGRSVYRLEFDDDSWFEARSTVTKVDKISDDSVNCYGNIVYPNETFVKLVPLNYGNATYVHTYELVEQDPLHYAKNMISVNYTTYTSPEARVHINSAASGQSSYGLITVTNAAKYINVYDCSISTQNTKAEAENQVVYIFSGSVGFTLRGVFSIGVSPGATWTQYAITRLSPDCQFDYAAYYY